MNEIVLLIEGMYCDNCPRLVMRALEQAPGVAAVRMEGDLARVAFSGTPDLAAAARAVADAGYYTNLGNAVAVEGGREPAPQAASGSPQAASLVSCADGGGAAGNPAMRHEAALAAATGGDASAESENSQFSAASAVRAARLRNAGAFALAVAAVLLAGAAVNALAGYNVFNAIPVIGSDVPAGMLFATGLLTSLHCMSMCGAIGLAASTGARPAHADWRSPVAYNLGRLASYTALGAVVGALGGVIQVNRGVAAAMVGVAAVAMMALALRMGGIVRFRVPLPAPLARLRGRAAGATGAPLIVGIANGLMPCGPLQAMQLYALSTGSAAAGAASMFLFCLGTVPLMLVIGLGAGALRGRGRAIVARVAGAFMLVLAASMLSRALSMGGVNVGAKIASMLPSSSKYLVAQVQDDGTQVAGFDLQFDGYADVQVRRGVPVRLVVHVDEERLTGCNGEVIMPAWGIDERLVPGDNIIEFTPEEEGVFEYTCWMNMITNEVRVVA